MANDGDLYVLYEVEWHVMLFLFSFGPLHARLFRAWRFGISLFGAQD